MLKSSPSDQEEIPKPCFIVESDFWGYVGQVESSSAFPCIKLIRVDIFCSTFNSKQ